MAIEINAPMAGKVIDILVEIGQEVSEDEPTVMLEAMKVEMPIAAPEEGTVTVIHVQPGDTVEAEALLMELE
jgi:biotin carboxyl carrier protein